MIMGCDFSITMTSGFSMTSKSGLKVGQYQQKNFTLTHPYSTQVFGYQLAVLAINEKQAGYKMSHNWL